MAPGKAPNSERLTEILQRVAQSPRNLQSVAALMSTLLQGQDLSEISKKTLTILSAQYPNATTLLYLLREKENSLELIAENIQNSPLAPAPSPQKRLLLADHSLINKTIQTSESYTIENIDSAHFSSWIEQGQTRQFLTRLQAHSLLCLPLRVHHRVIGVLVTVTPEAQDFNLRDIALFELGAFFLAYCIENILALENEKLIRAQLQKVSEAALSIAAGKTLTSVLQFLVEEARKIVHARYAALGVLEDSPTPTRFTTWVYSGISAQLARQMGTFPRPIGLLGTVPLEGHTIRIRSISDDPRFHGFPPHHPQMKSFLGVPIILNQKGIGNLYLADKVEAEEFSSADTQAIELLASHAAIAIENAQARQIHNHAEEELQKQRTQNQYNARLIALGEMAAGIAHEINNPLSVVLSLSQFALRRFTTQPMSPEELKPLFEKLEKMARRIGKIIDGLRAFAGDTNHSGFESASLASIVESAVELSGARIMHHGIDLQIAPIPEDLFLDCNAVQISQILVNLLNNAHDAVLNLSQKWIRLDLKTTPTELVIQITDSGRGVPPALREKIMQPFFTTKPLGEGTGLGLSISKGIAESHGGSLEIDIKNPRTCFLLRLPRQVRSVAA